jgi:hypothetical protein
LLADPDGGQTKEATVTLTWNPQPIPQSGLQKSELLARLTSHTFLPILTGGFVTLWVDLILVTVLLSKVSYVSD